VRVLYLTNMYPTEARPYFGIFVKRQVDALRATGVDTAVFFTDATSGRRRYLTAIPNLRTTVREGGFDVIHAQHTYCVLQLLLARTASRATDVPLVLTVHEGEVYGGLRSALRQRVHPLRALTYARGPKRLALQKADYRISVAAGLPEQIGYSGTVEVLGPGTDLDQFRPAERSSCRDALDLPHDRPVVFFPADPNDQNKGFDVVRASLRQMEPEPLLLCGGAIPPSQMAAHINASDVVAQASSYEAAPTVIREAVACGVPVVSTAVGDAERLLAGLPGCFVADREPNSFAPKIERAIAAERYPDRGRARLEELGMTLAQTTERHSAIYRNLAEAA
jgi:teichuronic acid biosynthesis glycosyltransferase TuaC